MPELQNNEEDHSDASSPIPSSVPHTSSQVSNEGDNKTADKGSLLNSETNPTGNFNYHSEGGGDKAASASALANGEGGALGGGVAEGASSAAAAGGAAAEALGAAKDLYAGAENPGRLIRRINWTRRKTIFGGLAGILTGGAIFGAIIASGPLEIIHVSEILLHSFDKSSSDSQSRGNALFRYYRFAKTGDIGETRVGLLGSKVFGKTIQQLSDAGITFERNKFTGNVDITRIDTAKLEKQFPELKDMGAAESKTFLADKLGMAKLGISPDELKLGVSSNGGYTFTLEQTDYGVSVTKALNKNTLGVLDDGWVSSTIKSHTIGKFFNEPSILHPVSRIVANGENKLGTATQNAALEKAQQKALSQATEDSVKPDVEAVKSSAGALKAGAGGALLLTAAVCAIRDTSSEVVKINYGAVVAPAALQATRIISVGQQVKSGEDVDPNEVAAVKQGFYSKDGNIYHGQAFRALGNLDGNGKITGTDLPGEDKQAFSNATTAKALEDNSGANTTAAALACSTAGKIFQVAAGIGLIISGFATGGATWSVYTGVKLGAGAIATGAAIVLLEHIASNAWSTSAVRDAAGSPVGGSLLAYGSRAAANTVQYASGGISLANNTATAVTANNQSSSGMSSFESKSTFARIFDVNDYRSLSGRFIDMLSPSWTQNIASMATGLGGIFQTIPHIFSSFMPKAAADATDTTTDANYDWAFPQVGIPTTMLNDPNLADPYANASDAAQILRDDNCLSGDGTAAVVTGCATASRINNCFGDSLSYTADNGWDVTPDHQINPAEDSYVNANCDDIGKSYAKATPAQQKWQRIIMFVTDTMQMKSMACQQGDDQSCAALGMGGDSADSSDSSATGSPVAASGSAAQIAQQLLDEWGKNLTGNDVVKSDLTATSQGKTITNSDSCGNTISIDANLLQVLLTTTTKYKLFLDNIVSGHGCDQFLHPKGRASDLGGATNLATGKSTNFTPGSSGDDQSLDRSFYVYVASIMPKGSELGQDECTGRTGLTAPPGITFFEDTCTHQHIDLGNP